MSTTPFVIIDFLFARVAAEFLLNLTCSAVVDGLLGPALGCVCVCVDLAPLLTDVSCQPPTMLAFPGPAFVMHLGPKLTWEHHCILLRSHHRGAAGSCRHCLPCPHLQHPLPQPDTHLASQRPQDLIRSCCRHQQVTPVPRFLFHSVSIVLLLEKSVIYACLPG